jgi:rod shape-determining protein MreC
MYNLLRFLQKHHFVLLFLLLEAISIYLLSNSHTYHRAAIVNTTNSISGFVLETGSGIGQYFGLKRVNRMLAEQNAQLQQQLLLHRQQADTSFNELMPNPEFEFIAARVISNTVHLRNNYIIINKGSKDGIEKEMGIISTGGVAGIITGVSENYATALSLLHKHARLSVKFSKNNQLANLAWYGPDFRHGVIEDIPTHIDIMPGDTVVTSGHSLIFPEGIKVGVITEYFQPEGSGLNNANIRFTTDFNKLRYVFIVSNKNRWEIEQLKLLNNYE